LTISPTFLTDCYRIISAYKPESAMYSMKSLGDPKLPLEFQGLLAISWFIPSLKLEPHARAYPAKRQ
jgi:hypothetical protein